MSSPFLVAFADAVVSRLIDEGQIDIVPGQAGAVVSIVATRLATAGTGESLVSVMSRALLSCDAVEELYIDDMQLKEVITELPHGVLPRADPL